MSRLTADEDAWIATGDTDGNGYLVPLSFLWDGAGLVVATPEASVTERNLRRGARVRVGVGDLRDVTMIEGTAEPVADERTLEAYAAKNGWDPRGESGEYAWFRIVPDRVQAWREANELPGRTLMRGGEWLA